jgi:hypothetical protein
VVISDQLSAIILKANGLQCDLKTCPGVILSESEGAEASLWLLRSLALPQDDNSQHRSAL